MEPLQEAALLVRVSIIERGGGLSVAVSPALIPALVAGLATFPQSVEALLRAVDAVYWGASHLMVGALIDHDRQELLWRQGYRPPPPRDAARDAWAITDETAYRQARSPAAKGLLWIDLAQRSVRHALPAPGLLVAGEVPIFDGERHLARTVTYDLRGGWDIMSLTNRFSGRLA